MKMKATIMVVDDNPDILFTVKENLEALEPQFTVVGVASGFECLKKVKEAKPDLILMDIVMFGMDGWETVANLKRDDKTSGIPIIYLTGKTDKVSRSIGSITASGYIEKPFTIEELIKKIRYVLEGKSEQPSTGNTTKEFIKFVGGLIFFVGFTVFFITFMTAYYHPTKQVLIDINLFGEAHLEYWIVLAMLFVGILALSFEYSDLTNMLLRRKTIDIVDIKMQQRRIAEVTLSSIVYLLSKKTSKGYAILVTDIVINKLKSRHPALNHLHMETNTQNSTDDVISVDKEISNMSPREVGAAINALIQAIDHLASDYSIKNELWPYLKSDEETLMKMKIKLASRKSRWLSGHRQ